MLVRSIVNSTPNSTPLARKIVATTMAFTIALTSMPLGWHSAFAQGGSQAPVAGTQPATNMALPQGIGPGGTLAAAAAQPTYAAPEKPSMKKTYNVPGGGGGVNLFTGDVSFTQSLGKISGRNGLSWSLNATYSSNVWRSVAQWNGDEPTSYLGLGWTLEMPRILVDTRNTGRMQDDTYYLAIGGNKQRLMLDPNQEQSDSVLNFRTQQWSSWKIRFTPVNAGADGKWDLTDENGLHYKFDGASVPGGVQWGVRWGGWIGPTHYGSANDGAENFPVVYNLTSIEEPWGDKLSFTWQQDNQYIGATGNRQYGRENRLVSITSASMGTRMILLYGDKANNSENQEYVIPHKTSGNISYYQDLVETKYLASVENYRNITQSNPNGDLYSYTKFAYDWVNAYGSKADYVKRVLTRIETSEAESQQPVAPPTLFSYYTDPKQRDTVGALQTVTTAAGGTVTYSYATQLPAQGSVKYEEARPDGYSKQRTWYGEDYTVTMWVKPTGTDNQATVQFHTNEWRGRWNGYHSADITVADWTKVQVETSRDFYAALFATPGTAYPTLWLDRRVANGWNATSIRLSQPQDPNIDLSLAVGDNFAVVAFVVGGTGIDGEIRWDGSRWYDRYSTASSARQRLVRARGDFYISATWPTFGDLSARLVTVSREGWANFVTPNWTVPISDLPNFFDLEVGSSFGFLRGGWYQTTNSTHWYGYAIQLGLGTSDTTVGTVQKIDVSLGTLTWYWPLHIVDSTIGMGVQVLQMLPPSKTLKSFTTADIFNSNAQAAATPFVYMPEAIRNGISQYYQFHLSAWGYDPATNAWAGIDSINKNDQTNGTVSAGREFFYANNNGGQPVAETRTPNGNWSISASMVGTKAWLAERDRIFVSADANYDKLRFAAPDGAMTMGTFGDYSPPTGNTYVSDDPYASARSGKRTLGPNTVVSWPSASGRTFENASALTLERTYNYSSVPGYPGPYTSGAASYLQPSIVVSQIVAGTGYETTNAGLPAKTTRFSFDASTATMDPTGTFARYNHVTVSQGAGGNASTSDHFGQTEYYFYNGLNPTALPNWKTGNGTGLGNEGTYYTYLDGVPYFTADYLESFDGSNWTRTLKSTSATSYNVVEKNLASLRPAYYVQPIYAVSYSDGAVGSNGQLTGVKTETGWGYYQASDGAFENFIKNVQVARINANGVLETTDTTYTYAGQVTGYATGMLAGNYLLPVAQVRTSKAAPDPNSPNQTCVYGQNAPVACTILAVGATTYKDWGSGRWGPVAGYAWNRGAASPNFNFTAPNTDWLKGAETTAVNAAGLVTETKYSYGTAPGGAADQQTILYSSVSYDTGNRFAVASFADARSSGYRNAGYIGFESYESLTDWAVTGNAALATSGNMHTGAGALASIAAGDMLSPKFTKVASENRGIQVASLYAQIPDGKTLTLKLEAMTGTTVNQTYSRVLAGTAATATGWQYIELAGTWAAGQDGMRLTVTANSNGVRIDNIRFGAAAAPFGAQVVNVQKGLVTASLGHNGEVNRALYDAFNLPIVTAGPTEQTTSTAWSYFSRFAAGRDYNPTNPQLFNPNDPNATGAIAGMDGGQYDDFRNGTSKWNCDNNNCTITAAKGDFAMSVSSRAVLKGNATKNIAVRARIDKPTTSHVSFGAASWQVVYVTSQKRYEFSRWSGSTSITIGSVDAPYSEDWLLVAIDNQFFFISGGKILFTDAATNTSPRAPTLQDGYQNQPITIRAFATYVSPTIAMQFVDAAGRTIQSAKNFGDRNAKISGALFNANWDRTVAAKAVDYPSTNTVNGLYFRSGYIGRDASGRITGDVTAYYGSGAYIDGGYTNDGGYPFWGGANRREPADRAATRGQPGLTYNTEASGAKIASFDYGINQGGTSGASSTNLVTSDRNAFQDNAFLRSKSTTPNNANQQSFATATGGSVGGVFLGATTYGQAGQNIQTLRTMDAYDRTNTLYHPNYFASEQDTRDSFKASLSYDAYDRTNSMTTVDSGTARSIRNRAGQLRYWADANSIAAGRISYAKYDKYGRLIEAGQVAGSITDSTLQASAEDINQPANTEANWRLRYVYDRGAFGQEAAEAVNVNFLTKGRLIGIQTRDAGSTGNEYSSQAFVYDERGRVNAVYEVYRPYGVGQITAYSYNNLGMPTRIIYPKPVGSTALLAGTCSAPTPAKVDTATVAQVNSNLERNVWSFSDYIRASLDWITSWSGGNSQRIQKDELLRTRGVGGDLSCVSTDPSLVVAVTALVLGLRTAKFTQTAPFAVLVGDNALPDSGINIEGEADFFQEVSISRITTADAPTVTYSYNQLGQITSIGNATDPLYYATYSYGPNGEILTENRYRHSDGDMHYNTKYRYDSLGRPISTSLTYGSSYTYWQENLAYETGGGQPNYDNKISRLSGCQWNAIAGTGSNCDPYSRDFTYLVEGALATALDYTYSYLSFKQRRKDASSNLLLTDQGYQLSPGNGSLATFTYGYYAGTNRISSVIGPVEGDINYTYDANGNVKTKSRHIAGMEYDPFSNRVTKVTQADQNNQPLKSNYQLRYGGLLGERVSSTHSDNANSQIVESVYFRGLGFKPLSILRQARPASSTDNAVNYPVSYKHMIYGPKGIVAMVAQEPGSSGAYTTTEYWPVQNYQGSVVSVYKEPTAGGHAVSMDQFQYSATGNIYRQSTPGGKFTPYYDQEPLVPYLFQGQEYDWQAQLHNFNARLYDSQTLTFLQPDPKFSVGMGSYIGLANDPVNMIDADGRQATYFSHKAMGLKLFAAAFALAMLFPSNIVASMFAVVVMGAIFFATGFMETRPFNLAHDPVFVQIRENAHVGQMLIAYTFLSFLTGGFSGTATENFLTFFEWFAWIASDKVSGFMRVADFRNPHEVTLYPGGGFSFSPDGRVFGSAVAWNFVQERFFPWFADVNTALFLAHFHAILEGHSTFVDGARGYTLKSDEHLPTRFVYEGLGVIVAHPFRAFGIGAVAMVPSLSNAPNSLAIGMAAYGASRSGMKCLFHPDYSAINSTTECFLTAVQKDATVYLFLAFYGVSPLAPNEIFINRLNSNDYHYYFPRGLPGYQGTPPVRPPNHVVRIHY